MTHNIPIPSYSRDVEDVLQDVFYELVEANRLPLPIEHVTPPAQEFVDRVPPHSALFP